MTEDYILLQMLEIRRPYPEEFSQIYDHLLRHLKENGKEDDVIFHVVADYDTWKKDEAVPDWLKKTSLSVGEKGWQRRWVLLDSDKVVGLINLQSKGFMKSSSHRCYLGMGLELPYRGKGYGRKMVSVALDWARKQTELDYVDLGVFSGNVKAIELYKKFGFSVTAEIEDAFRLDGKSVDEIMMSLSLRKRS